MAAVQRGLGKGLEALLKSGPEKAAEGDIKQLPLAAIEPNQFQPRRHFNEEGLKELALSIRSQGVLQPILVRDLGASEPQGAGTEGAQRYELIAGERRLRAAKMCGLETIPAMVRELSDDQSLILAMIENLQREDLNPIDEASGLASLQKRLDANQDGLARAVGKSRPAVANALRLLQLPSEVQDEIRKGGLSAGHGRALLAVEDAALQMELFERIKVQQLSVRQVEQLAAYIREHGELPEGAPAVQKREPRSLQNPGRVTDPQFRNLQQELTQNLALKVRLQGTPDKGKMILSFTSEEQLRGILSLLGMEG